MRWGVIVMDDVYSVYEILTHGAKKNHLLLKGG